MRADGGGLYLEVLPNGSRYWWLIVRGANKKTKKYKLGDYPEVGIKTARELCVLKRREVACRWASRRLIYGLRSLPFCKHIVPLKKFFNGKKRLGERGKFKPHFY